MIIVGIDPGTASVGFGVIRKIKNKLQCLEYGVIRTQPTTLHENRLNRISIELSKLLKKYKPKIMVVERLYFFKNLKTALPVSEAKGVILLTAAKKRIKIEQFTPLQVKARVCGHGRADKKDVQKAVKKLLKLKEIPKPDDAADGLAIAICYAKTKPV